jgi:antitoxin component YwqK of YwqJK toxin-antitoxin module
MYNRIFILLILSAVSLTCRSQNDTINQTDAQGLKQGYWEKRDPQGNLVYQGYFKDNKPEGEMKRYYETGELKAILNYRHNSEIVHTRFYYDTGEIAAEGLYLRNQKDSLWKYYSYYTGALTSTEIYANGVKQGIEKKYYPNGQVSEEIEWQNGIKNGMWNQYFDDRTAKMKSTCKNNQLTGPYTFYWPNGRLYIQGWFVDDKREGKWLFYTDEGKLKWELNYVKGRAENEEQIIAQDQEFFKTVDQNIGKFQEPTIEDVTSGKNPGY